MSKVIRSSKFTELAGLDRIQLVAHEAHCIFREITKDDLGVDGEIEVLSAIEGGEGYQPTGNIIKVQAKSGMSYVKEDSPNSFSTPISQDDVDYWMKLNYPLFFIVYHPKDNQLYFKEVRSYFEGSVVSLQTPLKIIFDKKIDVFGSQKREAILEAAKVSAPKVNFECNERLFSNLLHVQRYPSEIWSLETEYSDYSVLNTDIRIKHGFVPPFSLQGGRLYSFTNLSDSSNILTQYCLKEVAASSEKSKDWFSSAAKLRLFVQMLNQMLRRHAYRHGIAYAPPVKRYYFALPNTSDLQLYIEWYSTRTKRSSKHLVAKRYEYGRDTFWRHDAADLMFEFIKGSWFLKVTPEYLFTTDGKEIWDSEKVGSFTTRIKSAERNLHVLNQILMWGHALSGGSPTIDITLDSHTVIRVNKVPQSGVAKFAIVDDPAIIDEPPLEQQASFFDTPDEDLGGEEP